jgi:hypothetical protein
MRSISIDVDIDIDDIISNMNRFDKQAMVDDLYDDGFIAVKDKESDYGNPETELDEACLKIFGNGWRVTKEEEEYIINLSKRF